MRKISGTHHIAGEHPELLKDESSLSGGNCQTAAWPENAGEAADFLKECSEDDVPVTISGARTGIAGGAIPMGGAVLSTEKLTGIRRGTAENTITVAAGETLDGIAAYCRREMPGWFYPPDPTETTASIGGTLATDASGASSYLYGSTRNWISRVNVILPSGRELDLRRGEYHFHRNTLYHPVLGRITLPLLGRPQPPKNAAGLYIREDMDLIDLFIGSEGTMGLITEADLILREAPYATASFAVFCDKESFWSLRSGLMNSTLRVRELEAMVPPCLSFLREHAGFTGYSGEEDWVLITSIEADSEQELDSILEALEILLEENSISPDCTWGGFDHSERKRLKEFRHLLPETVNRLIAGAAVKNPLIHKISTDTAVSASDLREHCTFMRKVLEEARMEHVVFGHCGQGHLHSNLIPSTTEELERAAGILRHISKNAVDMNGTVSAEHGTGKLKSDLLELMYSRNEMEQMNLLRVMINRS